ncbi:MAG TPA: imidazolonepropionase [Bacteroidia bacterium]|jgi:imidazolonepropionase|nr:imidazolonepropionase [Bacteroidia bacterium]
MKILIENIKTIVGANPTPKDKLSGKEMSVLPCVDNAWISIADGLISAVGTMKEGAPAKAMFDKVINAEGRFVFPSWCDSHTHIVYAGSREAEFVDRIRGLSYEEIARNGGGILNSAERLNKTSEDELFESAMNRLKEITRYGTGAVEIKSGYGLSVEGELKMLRVIKKLKQHSPLTIKANFLGAHAMPTKYKQNRQEYIDLIINEMLPVIAKEKLADYCDVFCDRGFYTVEETDTILQAGLKYGLQPKIHANELDYSGGIQVGVKNNALSVDHLEFTGDVEIECLLKSKTMPTLLPSTAFFLGLHYPPARKMIDAGLPLALATDYNPGSSPSGRMVFIISLACVKLKMLPEEAINAATVNSAYAMGVGSTHGTITVGKTASLFITHPIPSYNYLPYSFGSDLIETVMVKGEIKN